MIISSDETMGSKFSKSKIPDPLIVLTEKRFIKYSYRLSKVNFPYIRGEELVS